jgi:hypothetical protein
MIPAETQYLNVRYIILSFETKETTYSYSPIYKGSGNCVINVLVFSTVIITNAALYTNRVISVFRTA